MNSHPELVGSELVDVGSLSWYGLVPEAELQQKLVPARHQHLTPLFPVHREVLPTDRQRSTELQVNWLLLAVIGISA